jgi:hypothetical protein
MNPGELAHADESDQHDRRQSLIGSYRKLRGFEERNVAGADLLESASLSE